MQYWSAQVINFFKIVSSTRILGKKNQLKETHNRKKEEFF